MPTTVKLDYMELNNDGGNSTEALSSDKLDIVGTLELFADIWSLFSVLKLFPEFTSVTNET